MGTYHNVEMVLLYLLEIFEYYEIP